MTDTALHRDLETLNLTTPNGRIKAQLLGLYCSQEHSCGGALLDK